MGDKYVQLQRVNLVTLSMLHICSLKPPKIFIFHDSTHLFHLRNRETVKKCRSIKFQM